MRATIRVGVSRFWRKQAHPTSNCFTTSITCRLWRATSSGRFRTHHGAFGHIHTAGNPGRHELSPVQEINYPAVFRAVAESGYSGVIGHEFIPTGDAEDSLRRAYHLVLGGGKAGAGFFQCGRAGLVVKAQMHTLARAVVRRENKVLLAQAKGRFQYLFAGRSSRARREPEDVCGA